MRPFSRDSFGLLLILAAACAVAPGPRSSGPVGDGRVTIRAVSYNPEVNALRVDCRDTGRELAVLRIPSVADAKEKEVLLGSCRQLTISVDLVAQHRAWAPWDGFMVCDGDVWVITVENYLPYTRWEREEYGCRM